MVKIFWIWLPQNRLFIGWLSSSLQRFALSVSLTSPAVIRKELEQMKGLWVLLWLYALSVSSLQWKSQAVQHWQLQARKYIA